MRFSFFTFGGSQFWADVFFYQKWRIQRNCVSKTYRLLDAWDIVRHKGTFEECRKAFINYIDIYELPRQDGKMIVMLHGFGENKNISFTCTDYKYNEKGLRVSSESFNLDPETEQRGEKISSSETTYDSLGRTISMIQNYYEGESISSGYKTEYEYINDNNSYIYSNYYLNDEGNDWILSYKTKHEYVTLGNESYYYLDSNWNEETEDWETSSGYKSIYEGNSSNYTQMEYSWNKDAGDWVLTYGYRYAYEIDGENSTQINAYFDTDNNQWRVDYSYKTEVTEGNPKVCKNYILPGNDIENWGLTGSVYYYYSESGVANETIQTVDARIYTRQGTIHIDMEGVADLWIYTVNGACCYQSSISGTTDVSNLQGGIYIVVLQSDSGTKKVKVLVK